MSRSTSPVGAPRHLWFYFSLAVFASTAGPSPAGAINAKPGAAGPDSLAPQARYFPKDDATWERRRPQQVGMDSTRLQAAINWAMARTPARLPTDSEFIAAIEASRVRSGETHPHVIGPIRAPGPVNGMVIKNGYIVAEFGNTKQVDVTASLTKSILALAAGVAVDRGLVKNLDEPVALTVKDGGYDSPQNAPITWRMHLQQTSEWEGSLFGMPDSNDKRQDRNRRNQKPGTFYEYNDVRVNRLSLSLLHQFKRPLPEIFQEAIMGPIGASDKWGWFGYRTMVPDIDGRPIQSVSGGTHWGGGFWVNSYDLGRIGLMLARHGQWNGKTVLSKAYLDAALTPSPLNRGYGFLFWLNTTGRFGKTASPRAYTMAGGGGFYCWVDRERDLVLIVKALGGGPDEIAQFVDMVHASFTS
ncbi:MAG TPA: serine hydrolase [Gemmatimonas sp.]|uniref:serine hydrolase domain-containing protein n=1 Tax=Gemmatimonas sp. TaxID=1962908 RepID=UPI002EDB6E9F